LKVRHYLWCLALLGIIGFVFYQNKSAEVFPSASIDIRLSKKEIGELARSWAGKLNYKEIKPIQSTVFAYDDDAKTFLEYELGASQANALMKETIPIWYWSTRLCQQLKQEQFTCWTRPDGRLISFEHEIENDRALPSFSHDVAKKTAEDFVNNEAKFSLDGYKLIEDASVVQAHRTDHHFTWEDTRVEYHGAKLRTHVYISGRTITAFNHFLYVPEEWTRKFAKLRSYNDALAEFATIFYVALQTGSFFLFVWAFASGLIRWRFCLVVSVFYTVFFFIESLNDYAVSLHDYSSSMPFAGFELEFLLSTLYSALGTFVQTFVLTASGEALYRKFFPEKMAIEHVFSELGLRAKNTLNGLIAGASSFGIHLGWIVVFYLYGRPLGLWCPMEVQNVESLSSSAPAISALHVGFSASLSEEFLYRIIGLVAFQRLVRNFWLANFLQAAAWAFMHSNYPQEPPFARGLELTFVGFFYGTIMRFFGILPCVFSHNLIDTFLGLEPLLVSSVISLRVSAILTLLPFAAFILAAVILPRAKGEFRQQESLSNKELAPASTPVVEVAQELAPQGYPYQPLPKKARILLTLVAIASTLLLFLYKPPAVASDAQLPITRDQAIAKAQDYLEKKGVDSSQGYSVVAYLVKSLDDEEMQYVYEKDRSRFKELLAGPEKPLLWRVRFFKPLVQEEYLVLLDAAGNPMSFTLTEPENAPGATLTKEEAQKKVESYLNEEHKEITPFEFDDVTEVKRDARKDYTFEFKTPKYKIGEAEYRLTSTCIGDRVSEYDHGWILPDKWTFARQKKKLRDEICKWLVYTLWIAVSGAGIFWAKGVLKSQAIVWKPAFIIGVILSLATLVKTLNSASSEFYSGYETSKPLESFFVDQVVTYLLSMMTTFSVYTAISAFGLAALRLLLPKTTVPAILRTTFVPTSAAEKATSAALWIDATILAFSLSLSLRALAVLLGARESILSPSVTVAPLENVCYLANLVAPSVSTIIDAVSRGLLAVLVAAILVGLYVKYLRSPKKYFLFAIFVSLILPCTTRYWQDYIFEVATYLTWTIVGFFFISKLARDNLMAYFLAGFVTTLIGVMAVMLEHSASLYVDQLILMAALLLSPIAYIVNLHINRGKIPPIEADSGSP